MKCKLINGFLMVLLMAGTFNVTACSNKVQCLEADSEYFYAVDSQEEDLIANETQENINYKNLQSLQQTTEPFTGDTFVPNKNFLVAYYSHLKNNIPRNRLGICGYTAIAMFLSFYDTYWSDYFIPEFYDSGVAKISSNDLYDSSVSKYESPGVWNNIDSTSPSMDDLKNEIISSGITDEESIDFREALDRKIMSQVYAQIDSNTFLGRLFQIGINNGSIQPHFAESEYHIANEGYVDGIGVTHDVVNSVLSDYIEGDNNLRRKISIVSSKIDDNAVEDSERIRSEIINIVKTGRPVLMGGNNYQDSNNNGIFDSGEPKNGHVVVAYDYDETKDILYGNMGWSSNSQTHANLDAYFNLQFSDYWALNISSNLPMNRTNNYIFTDKKSYYSPGLDCLYNIIETSDYGFEESYGDANTPISKSFTLPNTEETIFTNRLRCGYIENTSINLSTRRYSPGISYLEYTFDKNLKSIEVDLSWWSSKERVSALDSNYKIEYLSTSGTYIEIFDLWNDVNLSTDRENPTRIKVDFLDGIKTFRFYGSANLPKNDRNKGRLSIFGMIVEYR